MNIAQRKSGDSSIDHKSLVHPPIGIITDALTFKVARLAALNEKAGSQHFKSKHGITLNQWRILGLAFALGPVSSREVREILYMDKGQFSRVVKELLGLGFIQAHANAEDGRAIELSVTERGRIIHDKLINFSAERNEAVVSVLTAEDCRKLIRLLDKVNAHTQALQKQ